MTSTPLSPVAPKAVNGNGHHPGQLPEPVLTTLKGFGGSLSQTGFLVKPGNVEEIRAWLDYARSNSLTVTMRGAAQSYGDANIGPGLVMDLSGMNRILDFDRKTGIITCEPGATVGDVWQHVVELGFWPPVVSGTMRPTLGGALAMNIHGKNHYNSGSLGDHVKQFTFMDGQGNLHTCSRESDPGLFTAVIGSAGQFGIFTEIRIKLKKTYSGYVKVDAVTAPDLSGMFDLMRQAEARGDEYVVGWVDGFARGKELGRAELHFANFLPLGIDQDLRRTTALANQELPPYIMGVFPKSWVWFFLQFFQNQPAMKVLNTVKFTLASLAGRKTYLQAHAAYHFLLDFVPNWNKSYRTGMIQYQAFVPRETAEDAFRTLIETHQRWHLPSYLLVTKRHRADDYLFSSNLDGYSMAMDFPVTPSNRDSLWAMCAEMDEIVLQAGGRFYLAKDATLRPGRLLRAYGHETLKRYWEFKRRLDPENPFQTSQSQRITELTSEKFVAEWSEGA